MKRYRLVETKFNHPSQTKSLCKNIIKNVSENTDQVDNIEVLLGKVEALRSGSEQSTKDFTNYIHREYAISDGVSFESNITTLLNGAIAGGAGYGMIKMVAKAVEFGNNAISGLPWITDIVDLAKYGGDGKFVFFGGSLWWLVPCFLACYAVMILYKIFVWALKGPFKENYSNVDTNLVDLYNELTIKEPIIESIKLLNKLKHITESTNIKENDMKQAAALKVVVNRATPKSENLLDEIARSPRYFIHKYRRLIAVILICVGLVLSLKNLQTFASKADSFNNTVSGVVASGIGIGKGTIGAIDVGSKEVNALFPNKEAPVLKFLDWLNSK